MYALARFEAALATLALGIAPAATGQCSEWSDQFGFPGTDGPVNALAVWNDGTGDALYVGGAFHTTGVDAASGVARWDGTTWATLDGPSGEGVDGIVHAMEVLDDGSGPALYVGGSFATAGGLPASNVARWDGSSWSALGGGVDGPVHALAVYDDGSGPAIFVGGAFDTVSGGAVSAPNVARWDGVGWSGVGSGLVHTSTGGGVWALQVHTDAGGTRLFAGGLFDASGASSVDKLVAWDGSAWSDVGGGPSGSSGPAQEVFCLEVFDAGSGPELFAGVDAGVVQRWNGASWASETGANTVKALEAIDDGTGVRLYAARGNIVQRRFTDYDWPVLDDSFNGTVQALAAFDSGGGPRVFAGGSFDGTLSAPASHNHLAERIGSTWVQVGPTSGAQDPVEALALFDDGTGTALYADRGRPESMFDRVERWKDGAWTALPEPGLSEVHALATFDDGSGEALYAAGGLWLANYASGTRAPWVGRFDGSTWTTVGQFPDGYSRSVRALHAFDDGGGDKLYAAGRFRDAGPSRHLVARWEGGSVWNYLPMGLPNGTDKWAYALETYDDGAGEALYVGGTFWSAGGQTLNHVARWDGSSVSDLAGGVSQTADVPEVRALRAFDDGTGAALYVGGRFDDAGGVPVVNVARWNGSAWEGLGSGLDGVVFTLEVYDDGTGPALYAGGEFTGSGAAPASRLARWNGAAWEEVGGGVSGAGDRVHVLLASESVAPLERELFVAGNFFTSGSTPASRIASWQRSCDCPPEVYCTAGTTAAGCVASISGSGRASGSAGSGFTIDVAGVDGQRTGILFYSVGGPNAVAWGSGSSFLCVKFPLQRMGLLQSGGTAGSCDGAFSIDWNTYAGATPSALGAPFTGGESAWAQCWFRDPPSPKTTSLSDALHFVICP